jgi:hypothetical protein
MAPRRRQPQPEAESAASSTDQSAPAPDADLVKAALAAAGIDTRDFGRFVNRPVPAVIEPVNFDSARALPILIDWLPRTSEEKARQAIVRHLAIKTADGLAGDVLLEEFRRPGSVNHRWVVADALAFACHKRHFPAITDLAADHSHATSRQPLVAMMWRVKTPSADQILLDGITDPDITLAAMSALRRRLGNAAARQHIAPLLQHADHNVRAAARQHLRRIDKKQAARR